MMSRELERKLAAATEIAKMNKHEFVTLEHILYALSESPAMVEILEACSINVQELRNNLRTFFKTGIPQITDDQLDTYGGFQTWTPEFTLACHRLIQRAAVQMKSAGRNSISEGSLLVAFFYEQESHATFALMQQGLTQFDIINYISHGITKDNSSGDFFSAAPRTGGATDSEDESKNSPLESFCVNLNEKAKAGQSDPVIGREDIIERAVQVLCRRTKNNPLIIGEPGVGKTAIAEGLAQKIVNKEVPTPLHNAVIYSLDLGSLLAGTKFRGDFEGRLKAIVKDLKKQPHAILFIDEIHTLVGAGATSGGSMDASNLLKPALASGEISCIGSTTYTEYRQYFEKDRALNRRFQKIDIKEPSRQDCIQILQGLKTKYEEFHNVKYSDEALIAAVDLSQKYIHNKLLPDKAIDVIDEAGTYLNLKRSAEETLNVDVKDVEEVVAKITGVPMSSISANEKGQLKELDKKLKALIYGQDKAIDKVVAAIKFTRSGLGRSQKPIGSFLFTGPTGVGKTEVCRQLATVMGIHFERFDMSEYMEKHTVARLVGAPPGYVGYEEGGLLTEAINKHPYCVLLLDEIEKAHTDIYNILLQVMDAGRLTDSNGRTADFTNVILILTSNAGALETSRGTIGMIEEQRSLLSMDAIKKTFSPEFINRLDAIVPFNDLSDEMVTKVTQKFVNELQMQLLQKKVELTVSPEALQWLKKKGYDKVYGARPLQRCIDEHLKKALVDELLFGQLINGGKVRVDLDSNSLRFHFSTTSPQDNNQKNAKIPVTN